jgi:hypothetical protein
MPMFQMAHQWRSERRVLHPETPWLKRLTPPEDEEQLVFELRGFTRPHLVSMSDTEVHFESNGVAMQWNLEAGETRLAAVPPLLTPDAPCTPGPAGGLTLKRRGQVEWLLPPTWKIETLCFSAGREKGGAIATNGMYGVHESLALVFDTSTGAQVWSHPSEEGGLLALSPGGKVVAWTVSGSLGCAVRLDGAAPSFARIGRPTSLAVSDSGRMMAIAEGNVLKVYRFTDTALRPVATTNVEPQFSVDGSVVVVGPYVLDGNDGTLQSRHRRVGRRYLEGGPPPFGTRLTSERWCVAEPFGVEVTDVRDGWVRRLADVTVGARHRVAWSGDGRVFAKCRFGGDEVEVIGHKTRRLLRCERELAAIALDRAGERLALLHLDGTVSFYPSGGPFRLRLKPTFIAFIAQDRALAVGGPEATFVVNHEGTELLRMDDAVSPSEASLRWLELEARLRSPSMAESLDLQTNDGLLEARHERERAAFPAEAERWVRSPSTHLIASDALLLSFERS